MVDANEFTGAVTPAVSGLPTGVSAALDANPITGANGLSGLIFAVSSTAAAGTSTITITGTSGPVTVTTTISLTVTAATGMAGRIGWDVSSQRSSGTSGSFGVVPTIYNAGTVRWTSWTLSAPAKLAGNSR